MSLPVVHLAPLGRIDVDAALQPNEKSRLGVASEAAVVGIGLHVANEDQTMACESGNIHPDSEAAAKPTMVRTGPDR